MSTILLAAVLCVAATEDDALLVQLQAEFDAMVKESPVARDLRQAELLLQQTDQSSHWTNYKQATALLRKARSKAAVPLLLKYMIEHAKLSTAHVLLPEYADTITLLTGRRIDTPYRAGPDRPKTVREQVDKLFREWWLPQKGTIQTDPGKMSREGLEVLADRLMQDTARQRDYSGSGGGAATAYRVYHILTYRIMNHGGSDYERWQPSGLHAAMAPILLAHAGYLPPGAAAGDPLGPDEVPYAAVDLLAKLRKDQEAPLLNRIAADPKQCTAARLTCILALYGAGEELDTAPLLSILDTETRLELRLVTIIALKWSRDTKQVVPRLIQLLDDRSAEIRTAAVCAVRGPKPAEAVPKLKKMIDELTPHEAMVFIFDVIGEIGTKEAQQALVDFLRDALTNPDKGKHISNALYALQTATGQRWGGAGAHDEAYYRQKAREALAWWDSQQGSGRPMVPSQLRCVVDETDTDRDGRIDTVQTRYLRDSEPVLVRVTRQARNDSPRTVVHSIFYRGQVVYSELSADTDPPSCTSRSYGQSGAGVGICNDPNGGPSRVVLIDPAGLILAIFGRERDGTLTPVDAEEFQRVGKQYAAAQRLAPPPFPAPAVKAP